MKVLFLTNIPTPYRVSFFNELGKRCELTVLYERTDARNRDKNWNDKKANYFKEIFLNGFALGDESSLALSVLKHLNKKVYDVIIIGGYSTFTGMLAISYLKIMKIPYILNVDGGVVKRDSVLKGTLKKTFIKGATAWLSTGNETNKYLLHYGAEQEKIHKYAFSSVLEKDILSSILTESEKQVIKKKLNLSNDKVVISVGQFIERKGFDVLLRSSVNIDENIQIYIIGGKPTREYLEIKEHLKLNNVHFLDFTNSKELKLYYLSADLFVLPTREDIWGLVINEAMSYGLPVITTESCVAGLELIEDNENGFIIPTESVLDLSNQINFLMSEEKLREDIGKRNLKKMKNYTIEKMAEDHIEIIKKIVTDREL